jgi:imidazole glycerol-phosphate synthase subunit HisH
VTVALIDYGAGNLQSVRNALKAAGGADIVVTADPAAVLAADRIVLPGVGAFAHCMGALSAIPGMIEALNEAVIGKARPFLGICVGMQLMAEAGEEHGVTPGLGWIEGRITKLTPNDPNAKIPHMGWNDVVPLAAHPLIEAGEAYFLHSFGFEGADILASTDHGGAVTAAIGRDNMIGVQFHPEKSQRYGIALLERFLGWKP